MNDLETSFDNGYELASEQEMNDARNMYQAQKARLQQALGVDDIDETQALQQDDLPYSAEEKQTIMDYLNAKATYDGMIQRVRDDIDSRIEAANTQIDLNTNATTGRIHSAVTSDDRKVYIVGGNVKLYEDGTIDRETSDKDIIIRDQETGQKEFWDIGMLKSIEAPIDPVDEKNAAAASVREQVARQAADKMDGRLHFQMGDVYTLTTPDGSSFPVQITANEQGIIDNGDGTVNVILNGVNLWKDGDAGTKVAFYLVDPETGAAADEPTAEVTAFITVGPNALKFAWPSALAQGSTYLAVPARSADGSRWFAGTGKNASVKEVA